MAIFLSYAASVFCASAQFALTKLYGQKGESADRFNLNKAIAAVLTFLLIGLFAGLQFHFPTVLAGLAYGIFLLLSMYAGFAALVHGPMSLTSVISSFSLIVPVLFGITVFQEHLAPIGWVGLVLLCASIVLLNLKKDKQINGKWGFFALMLLLTNGFCSVVQTYHQTYFPGQYQTEFMLIAMAFVAVFLSIKMGVTARPHSDEKRTPFFTGLGLASGVLNGLANFLTLYLAAAENASILFPIVSAATGLLSWLFGRVLFHEKLRVLQIIGLVLGIAAVVLLKCP